MRNSINIKEDLIWVGADDRRLALFENTYPVANGISYNAYLILDKKTALLDTVDHFVKDKFLQNLAEALNGRTLDYLVISHMEPDHCATVNEVLRKYQNCTVIVNAVAKKMLTAYMDVNIERIMVVKEGDVISLGRRRLEFVMAPMVHWPEVMMTYEAEEGILFSADAFGSFGANGGKLIASGGDVERELDEYRRYYTNIVGKYGPQVLAALQKVTLKRIEAICPLHGKVFLSPPKMLIEKYLRWSGYQAEEQSVLIVYASVYGHTERAAEAVAAELNRRGIATRLYDVAVTHVSFLVAEAFRSKAMVLASCTIDGGIFPAMAAFIEALTAHNLKGRSVALLESGSWAPNAGAKMRALLGNDFTVTEKTLSFNGAPAFTNAQIEEFCADVAATLVIKENGPVDKKALYQLSYGLFMLSARDKKDNGCIVNTVLQLTTQPLQISVAVNKANFTHDLILSSGIFNVSVLDESAPMEIYQRFGMTGGRDKDKFDGIGFARSANGLTYLTSHANAFLSARVVTVKDLGSHTLFIAEVTEAARLGDRPSATYAYYQAKVKPRPAEKKGKRGFRCKVCGYEYIGDTLPPDFICPVCKHGAEDFEPFGF